MMAIQITQIENGFIVAVPPSEQEVVISMKRQQQPQPKAIFCSDYNEVCGTLKEHWPVTIS